MKQKFKIIGVLALTSLLVSCGGNDGNDGGDNDGINDIVYDDSGNIVYSGVNLNLWSVTTGDDATTQDNIVNKFNTLYDGMIHVNVRHESRYDLENLLTSTMQFDKTNAPDMLFNHGHRTLEYNEKGWLLPIEKYYEKGNILLDKDDFAKSLLDTVTINNVAYSVPIDVHSAMVEIREDILKKNGLAIPTNYDELVTVCESAIKLASEGKLEIRGTNSDGFEATEWHKATTAEPYTPFPIAYGDMWVHEFTGYTAAVQNGGSLVNSEGMPGWNSEETASGLQVLRDWIFPSSSSKNKNPLSNDYGSGYDVGIDPFTKGNAIFTLNGPWTYQSELQKFASALSKDGGSSNIKTRKLSSLFARDNSKEYASKIKGEGHAIMLMSTVESQTKRCASAVFADYLAYNGGIEWAKRGHIPAANSVVLDKTYKEDPAYEEYVKEWGTPNDYVVFGPTKNFSYVDTYFKNAVQKSMSNSFKDTAISKILNDEYQDCIDYIDLYN